MATATPTAASGGNKKTNVRIVEALRSGGLRLALRATGLVSARLAGEWAARLFVTPPRFEAPERERALLARAEPLDVRLGDGRIAAWAWGEGPAVLLVHGWGGRGAQLGAYVEPLVEAGFRAVAFDQPGHGASDGRTSSLWAFSRAILAVGRRAGPVHAVVAHSLGGAATVLAMRDGLTPARAVLVAPPAEPLAAVRRFAGAFGLGRDALPSMVRALERIVGVEWLAVEPARAATAIRTPVLIVHDAHDQDVPWTEGAALARLLPRAELLTTRRLGHRRILRDPGIVRAGVGFVREGARPAAVASAA